MATEHFLQPRGGTRLSSVLIGPSTFFLPLRRKVPWAAICMFIQQATPFVMANLGLRWTGGGLWACGDYIWWLTDEFESKSRALYLTELSTVSPGQTWLECKTKPCHGLFFQSRVHTLLVNDQTIYFQTREMYRWRVTQFFVFFTSSPLAALACTAGSACWGPVQLQTNGTKNNQNHLAAITDSIIDGRCRCCNICCPST